MHLNLKQWSAWSPTVETESEWGSWAVDPVLLPVNGSPKLLFIPAIRRRRLSKLGRMIMQFLLHIMENWKRHLSSLIC
jgi:hypothetical protein